MRDKVESRVFCGRRVASWQSPFREIPNSPSRETGNVCPAFSPLIILSRARDSEAEIAGEQDIG